MSDIKKTVVPVLIENLTRVLLDECPLFLLSLMS